MAEQGLSHFNYLLPRLLVTPSRRKDAAKLRYATCAHGIGTVASKLRAASCLLWETMEDALEDASQRPGTCLLILGNSIQCQPLIH
jgi:hypothetical protein